jgi:hypothetical protein
VRHRTQAESTRTVMSVRRACLVPAPAVIENGARRESLSFADSQRGAVELPALLRSSDHLLPVIERAPSRSVLQRVFVLPEARPFDAELAHACPQRVRVDAEHARRTERAFDATVGRRQRALDV